MSILVKWFKKIASAFEEKPKVSIDDFSLEHFMLYHGLVGSSAENTKQFKDVRADLLDALKSGKSAELSIALKLPPQWWDDKLQTIFSELDQETRQVAARLLLEQPPAESLSKSALMHDDWRVRSNAAVILASLDAHEAAEQLHASLIDTANNTSAAFCHIANALGTLQLSSSKRVLHDHLNHPELWIRVDSAAALSKFKPNEVIEHLATALCNQHDMSDYVAVAVSRSIPPAEFLNHGRKEVQDGGCAMLIGLVTASNQTFTPDVVIEANAIDCYPKLRELAAKEPSSAVRAAALLAFSDWIEANRELLGNNNDVPTTNTLNEAKSRYLENPEFASSLVSSLNSKDSRIDERHAMRLSGNLQVKDALPYLVARLDKNSPMLADVVDAIGAIGLDDGTPLTQLGRSFVDIEDRINLPPSKHPVEEKDAHAAKMYWHILRALGKSVDPGSREFLSAACRDFAPDKREQALESLVKSWTHLNSEKKEKQRADTIQCISTALDDSSVQVRIAALKGVSSLDAIDLLSKVLKHTDAKEASLSRQAFSTLFDLNRSSNKKVEDAVQGKMTPELDPHKRKKLAEFLDTLKQSR